MIQSNGVGKVSCLLLVIDPVRRRAIVLEVVK